MEFNHSKNIFITTYPHKDRKPITYRQTTIPLTLGQLRYFTEATKHVFAMW